MRFLAFIFRYAINNPHFSAFIFSIIPLRGRGRGGANFPYYPYIPLRGRGSKGWGELPSLSLHSPPWEGIQGVGRTSLIILIFPSVGGDSRGGANFTHYPYIPLRGRGSKGWGDRLAYIFLYIFQSIFLSFIFIIPHYATQRNSFLYIF
jgi:hypothetical protein